MRTILAEDLARLMREALDRRGLTEEHASYVVEGLLEASLRGIDSHGVRLFPTYIAELDGGRGRANPAMRWLGDGRAARLLDAGHALGLVAGRVACAEAARLAREFGIGRGGRSQLQSFQCRLGLHTGDGARRCGRARSLEQRRLGRAAQWPAAPLRHQPALSLARGAWPRRAFFLRSGDLEDETAALRRVQGIPMTEEERRALANLASGE